ncbi:MULTISPECIES: hypothetical protein [unclassified Serratia (in: enterobacteria)]|uniref:hypothetical protein n=1 Tax=unclassified Serratia (in: enterobacteria) TaxID=2647522 RepID=UPI00307624B4
MIKNIIFLLCVCCLCVNYALADDLSEYKAVILDGDVIYLSSTDLSIVKIENSKNGTIANCKIANFIPDDARQGVGLLILTSDKKAIIFYSSSRYMIVDELRKCKDGNVELYKSPDPKKYTLVDINFKRKLYLSLLNSNINIYQAIIAHFGSDENLIKAPGFAGFDDNLDAQGFPLPFHGQSVISPDGKYVAPVGISAQCRDNNIPDYLQSFPGVWDIEKKKRVTFKSKLDDLDQLANEQEINDKCNDLFFGKKTLKELQGKLK